MKKGMVCLTCLIVVALILVFFGWVIKEGYKECRRDSDCKNGYYCSSSFECRQIPIIQETTSPPNYDKAAWIIGISLIIAAIIIKWNTKKKPTKSHNAEEEGLYEDFLEADPVDESH